ncbi:MAG: RseA family anti-sigma factor, partial [Gammaproteobacteria bacterium]|nr:RseA family anti-sigma factor [Gammaproteobacteria bacterium]
MSAYIDDALSADEMEPLIRLNESSGQTIAKGYSAATRYHIMGEALRSELSEASMVDVSQQIHEALRNESFDPVEVAAAVKKPLRSAGRFDFSAWLDSFARPLAGMAVAASVSALVVVSIVQLGSPERAQSLADAPISAPADTPATQMAAQQPADDAMDAVSKEQQMADFNN